MLHHIMTFSLLCLCLNALASITLRCYKSPDMCLYERISSHTQWQKQIDALKRVNQSIQGIIL